MTDENRPNGQAQPTPAPAAGDQQNPAQSAAAAGEQRGAAQPRMQILAQFIRDLSFENVVAQKGLNGAEVSPEITVQVSLDARKRNVDHQYDVISKFKVQSKNTADDSTLFLCELDYGGVFHVEGIPDEQLHAFLMIECPRMLFPFVRRLISDVTRDGGFPPVNLDPVDFVALYRQEIARRAQQQQAATGGADQGPAS